MAALVKDSTSGHETSPGGTSGRLLCLAPKDCAKEALLGGSWPRPLVKAGRLEMVKTPKVFNGGFWMEEEIDDVLRIFLISIG